MMELGASLLYLFVLKCDAAILSYPLVNSTEMKLLEEASNSRALFLVILSILISRHHFWLL